MFARVRSGTRRRPKKEEAKGGGRRRLCAQPAFRKTKRSDYDKKGYAYSRLFHRYYLCVYPLYNSVGMLSNFLAERRLRRGKVPEHVAVVFGENLAVEPEKLRDFYVWCDEFGVKTATACVPDAGGEVRRVIEDAVADLEPPVRTTDGTERVDETTRVLSYVGGRDEFVGALKRLAEDVESGEMEADDIGFEEVEERLAVPGEPDLVVDVTDDRLSDVLVWQTVYSELCHVDKFDRSTFVRCLDDYRERDRRFGR